MIPVNQGLIAAFQYKLIGFDLPFKARTQHGTWEFLQKFAMTSGFIALAINGYIADFNLVSSVSGHSLHVTLLIQVSLLISSSNFLKALALWGSFMIQSPVSALKCRPKYAVMPGCSEFGFPANPFATVWLHPMKWLYAMLLS